MVSFMCGPIFEKCGEDMLGCPYKDYISLNRWQANWGLLSIFTLCNLLSVRTHIRQGKNVSIFPLGDVCHVYCAFLQIH
jgi:hypothetical protein